MNRLVYTIMIILRGKALSWIPISTVFVIMIRMVNLLLVLLNIRKVSKRSKLLPAARFRTLVLRLLCRNLLLLALKRLRIRWCVG